ncbi:hypothetical protein PIB30_112135, partial [Stylosanthes scabra]|nr:hypothetical protein [Stylosanthes scabra]
RVRGRRGRRPRGLAGPISSYWSPAFRMPDPPEMSFRDGGAARPREAGRTGKKRGTEKEVQHEDFPGAHPSMYYSRPSTLSAEF